MSEHRLSEITIERPRGGMRRSLRKVKGARKQLDRLTEVATEDGLLSPYLIKPRGKTKWLSDHLGPLRRFLKSHVGQPWDDVYSKLCRRLKTNTMAGQHVLSHVWDFVELHTEIMDGVLYHKPRWGSFQPLDYRCYRDKFYVHPETRILCEVEKKPRKRQRQRPPSDRVVIDAYHEYQQLNELWYLISYEDFPPFPVMTVRDVLRGEIPRQTRYGNINTRYAVKKKQCNKKEIRFILSQIKAVKPTS